MEKSAIIHEINKKQSLLCVGLDTDLDKIPNHLLQEEDPIAAFNKSIIDATKEFAISYKLNIAFYERLGPKGWMALEKTLSYIPKNCFTIADAKRGDIGNTADMYAKTFFETYQFHSITVSPYMGRDSVIPFLKHPDKWAILLALTSNEGASDFQLQKLANGRCLYEQVIEQSKEWGNQANTMYVTGATKAQFLRNIRTLIPNHFLLVPGVGAQGGSLEDTVKNGRNKDIGLLINNSRGIIYADGGVSFAEAAFDAARTQQMVMKKLL